MMELIKHGTKINFVGATKIYIIVSAIVCLVMLFSIFTKGFNFGIDFAGGTVVQVKFENTVDLNNIRASLKPVVEGDFTIQNFGEDNEVLIRVYQGSYDLKTLSDKINATLETTFVDNKPSIQRVEQVGPQVGADLKHKAMLAFIYSAIGILIYVAIRFEFIFAVGAIISLIHDIIITVGIFSLLGKEMNLTVLAAILTVVGYSLNDTIVIFDRIREKIKAGELQGKSWGEVINISINETLSRTILTSLLTFLAVISLYLFGGEVINGFALAMMIGIVVGTYSSFAIAATSVFLIRTYRGGGRLSMVKAK